jgi:hypothetical protein
MDNPVNHVGASIVDSQEGTMIPGTTLDRLTHEYDLATIHFIKMNIEGAEKAALTGMEETLQKTQHVCIATHDFKADYRGDERFRTKMFVEAFLEERGFVIQEREPDDRPWVRDHVYAFNANLVKLPDQPGQ